METCNQKVLLRKKIRMRLKLKWPTVMYKIKSIHTTTDEELKNAKVVLSQNVKADEESLFEADNTTIGPPLAMEKKVVLIMKEMIKMRNRLHPILMILTIGNLII